MLRVQLLTIFFFRDDIDNEEESKMDSEDEDDDNGNPAQPEYEKDLSPQSIGGDVEAVADNVDSEGEASEVLDVGEGGQHVGASEKLVIDAMVQNSEDTGIAVIAIVNCMGNPWVIFSDPYPHNSGTGF
jgi:hypothetical protein